MAHSNFIDCDAVSNINENFISEGGLKVEFETQNVNDDENVAVEVLGQLSGNYDPSVDFHSVIPIKTEDFENQPNPYTYIHGVQVEHCIDNDEVVLHHLPNPVNKIDVDAHQEIMINDHANTNIIVNHDNAIIDNSNDNNMVPIEGSDCLLRCSICCITMKDDNQYQDHIKVCHSAIFVDRPYKCDTCPMSFQRKSSLINHSKIHSYHTNRKLNKSDNNIGLEQKSTPAKRGPKRKYLKVKKFANSNISNNVNDQEEKDHLDGWNQNEDLLSLDPDNQLQPIKVSNLPIINSPSEFENEKPPKKRKCSIKTEENLDTTNSLDIQNLNNSDSRDKPYMCPFCPRTFARQKAMLNHVRIHNDNFDLTLECQKCHDIFDDIISLQAHLVVCVLNRQEAMPLEDEIPEEESPRSQSPDYNPFMELDTKRRFTINNNHHFRESPESESQGNHVCDICHKRFKTRQKVFRHMWVHRKKIHICEVCGLSFSNIKYLDVHRLTVHPSSRPFACNQCGKSFMSKQGLTEHMRVHKGWPDQYFCDICEKFFSSRQGFTIHGRIHTGERPYGCLYCPKSFRDGGTMKKHERIHTGERPHECPICHKRYNQKVVLREHIRGVHIMKKNSDIHGKCPVCGIYNPDKEELSEHMVRHSDELMPTAREATIKRDVEKFDRNITTQFKRKYVRRQLDRYKRNIHKYPIKTEIADSSNDVPETTKKRKRGRRKRNPKNRIEKKIPPKKFKEVEKKPAKDVSSVEESLVEVQRNIESVKQELHDDGLESENSDSRLGNEDNVEYNSQALVEFAEEFQQMNLIECEMCHMRFPSRNELITHIMVHI